MNASSLKIPPQLLKVLDFAKQYFVLLLFLAFSVMLGFLVFQINNLTQQEPSEDAVTEKLKTVQRPHIDQAAIDKIQQLEDQNVEVKSLFEQARSNPFSE